MKKILLLLALTISAAVAFPNNAPVVSGIPDKSVGPCGTFQTIELYNYVTDDSTLVEDIIWGYSGNSELGVNISNGIATISLPASNWYGNETITFIATDDDEDDPRSGSDVVSFTVAQLGVPSVGALAQPGCGETTGSVALSGLPASGTWTLIRSTGGVNPTGTGESTILTGVPPGSHTWTVTNSTGCISGSSLQAVINTPPLTPTAPAVGTITQPGCGETTGDVVLTGLPSSGTWTLTRYPGDISSTGTGESTTISGLTPESYTFTVRNTDGCTSVLSGPAVVNAPPLTPTAPNVGALTQPGCGETTGSVALSGLPASGSWTLIRSTGGVNPTGTGESTILTGVPPGSHTWTVTNSTGCISGSSSPAVINTPPLTPTAPAVGTITQPGCGETTGDVVLNGLPSSGTWTLTRYPGAISSTGTGESTTISGLTPESYTFTVRNTDGCTSVLSGPAVVNAPPLIPTAPNVGALTQPGCGETTGSVALSGLPASGTWTLIRSTGGVNPTGTGESTILTGVPPGSHTWTVTNSTGCISGSSSPAVINTPPLTPTAPAVGTITQPGCGETTGDVVLNGLPSSGTWTLTRYPGAVSSTGTGESTTISGLTPESYTFTVRNTDGCTSVLSGPAVVNAPPLIPTAPNVGALTQPGCGETTGSVALSGLPASGTWTLIRSTGGVNPTGTGESTILTGVPPGSHTWTVTNSTGCISGSSLQAVINTPPLTPTAPAVGTITQPGCGETTGDVVLTGLPSSGTWTLTRYPGDISSTGTGESTTISGLTPESYTFTVRNTDGCTSVLSGPAVVNAPPLTPTASAIGTITQPGCDETTGDVVLNGLPSSGTWTLTRYPGEISSTGTGESTTISGLIPESYTFTVRNTDGCTSVLSGPAVVNAPPLTPTAPAVGTITQPDCGETTGDVVLNGLPSSGTWTLTRYPGAISSSGTGESTTISGLTPESYTFTVRNTDGCTSVLSGPAVVNAPPLIPTAPNVGALTQPGCGETTGSVALSGLPASGTWTLIRSTGGVNPTGTGESTILTGVPPGSHTWTVTNSTGCISGSSSPAVINTPPLTPTAPAVGTITQPGCGETTGDVVLNGLPSSGTWTLTRYPGAVSSTGTGESTTISGLTPDSYTFTVRNTDGCTSVLSGPAVVNAPPLTPTAPAVGTITQPGCGETTGDVVLNGLPSSGTWTLTRYPGEISSTSTGESTTISGLTPDSYTFTVRNTDGCTSALSGPAVVNAPPLTPTAPAVGTITQPTCSFATGSVVLNGLPASGTWTLTRYPGEISSTGTGESTAISGLTPANYTWTVRNSDGCTSNPTISVTINTQPVTPGAPSAGSITQPSCSVATGRVVLSGLPSSGSWTLTRTPGGATTGSGSSTTISNLSPGIYTWTLTNSVGCTSDPSNSVTIATQPVTPSAPNLGTVTHPTCGVSTGRVALSGLPGTGDWTVTATGGATKSGTGATTTFSGLSSGSYTFTVRNEDGCTSASTGSVTINLQPPTPQAPNIASITQATCSVGTGSVALNGLPSSGSWVLTRYPGGVTRNGSGSSITISGLNPDAYTFTVTNSVGCTSTASLSVIINLQPETPTAPIRGTITQPTCYSSTGSVVLSGLPESGTWTLTRSPGGTSITGSGTVRSVSGLPSGNHTFIVRNSQGCSSEASNVVSVNSQPSTPTSSINLGDTYTACDGESVLLDAGTGFDTYSWSTGSSSRSVNVGTSGNYSVTVTEGDCSASADADVTFNSIPSVNLGPTISACVGESVTLDAGSGMDEYSWTTGATSRSINVTRNGSYGVTVERNNCSNEDNVQVIFNSLPLIPLETSYYGTSCINLDAANAGSTYQWNIGATTQTISACSTGTYSVIVTNTNNCSASKQTSVTIGEKPVVNLPSSLSGCEGESIEIDAGSGFASYLWSTGATSQSIDVTSSGNYSVTVTDSHNETASDNVPVTFHALPVVDLGSDKSICQSEYVELSAGSGFSTYSWSTGESTQSISVTSTGSYSVSVYDGNCSSSDEVHVQVKSLPGVDLGADISSCLGETVTLDAGAGFAAYNWNTGETTASIEVSNPGTYTVNVTDNGCSVIDNIEVFFNELPEVELGPAVSACEGDEVTLNAGQGFSSYLWSTGETTQSIIVTGSDTYTVTVSRGNCNASDDLEVTIHDAPKPELGPEVTSCEGELPVLDAGSGYTAYLWNTGATSQTISVTTSGTYSVVVSDERCEGADEVAVSLLERPFVDLGPTITACEGDNVTLDAGPGFDIYIWSTGENTQSILVRNTGEYLVSVNNMCGSTSGGVLVSMKAQPQVDLGDDTWIDVGAELLLDAGSGQPSYLWNTGATSHQLMVLGESDGIYKYWVEVTGQNLCQNSDTIVVTVGKGTGIGESFLNRNISVYPNPCKDRFFVRSDASFNSDVLVTIYDATGKILLLERWEDLTLSHAREIDISDFKPGIYMVSFYSDKERTVRKLIKY